MRCSSSSLSLSLSLFPLLTATTPPPNSLFFFISMVIHSIVVHRHRRSGLHSKPVARGYTQPYQTGVPQYYAVAQGQNAFVQQPMAYNPNMPYAAPKQQYPVAYPPQGYVPSHAASH